ncbi:hypothetical protein [Solicola sp. PLA-1-18]|uniref:hypothetical protein n=1 Tax=Solicola sp. PLA-1-18 TaxID=3380532 RepID=UPI003B7B2A3A
MKRIVLTLLAGVLAVGGLVAGAGTSTAAPAGESRLGSTTVVISPKVYRLVAGAGITPSTTGKAVARPTKGTLAVEFPIRGFKAKQLRTTHKGGIVLAAGGKRISISKPAVDLARGRVSARVSGTEVGKVGRVDVFTISRARTDTYGPARLKLTKAAAGALNTTFGVKAFAGGDVFAYATPKITKVGLRNNAAKRIAAALEEFVAGH